MDAIKYIKEKERMCEQSDCISCPLGRTYRNSKVRCGDFIKNSTEEAVNIVEQWSKEHPLMTNNQRDALDNIGSLDTDADRKYVRGVFNALPSAKPEQKIGHWIVIGKFDDCIYAKCDQCNITQLFYNNKALTNFCPNCGVCMRGEKGD